MNRSLLGQLVLSVSMSVAIASCGNNAGQPANNQDSSASGSNVNPPAGAPAEVPASTSTGVVFADFDWSTVPASTAPIGGFPYLTAPAGMIITDKGGSNETTTGYSELMDFYKLIMYNGSTFYNAEGKVAKLKFRMKSNDSNFNQYLFDSSVEKYLLSIGAKLIGTMKLTQEQRDGLNKDDDMTIYKHIVGDPYNEPVKFYALNHANKKIMFQVFSNTATGDVGVVELAAFEQTIKAPTATQMKSDIDATGKAVLNINFDTDKSTLRPDGQTVVDEILMLLKNNPELKISIEGHTDNSGSAVRNKTLSAERANAVLKSLTSRGIDAARLSATGYGSEKPIAPNDNDANMAMNRRVELVKK